MLESVNIYSYSLFKETGKYMKIKLIIRLITINIERDIVKNLLFFDNVGLNINFIEFFGESHKNSRLFKVFYIYKD